MKTLQNGLHTETYFIFEANSIESKEKKRTTLIAVVGDSIVERLKFYGCVKSETEILNQYLARLKSLARTCSYGKHDAGTALIPQVVLEECLRDKFVLEMKNNTNVQQRLSRNKPYIR